MAYQRGYSEGNPRNWWETSSGNHIEPVGGGASAIAKAFTGGKANDVSRVIDSHRDLTFGTGDRPGILGTGQFNPEYYRPEAGAANIPGYDAYQAQAQQGAAGAGNRTGPQWGGVQMDAAQQAEVRARQMALADMLQAQAAGTGGPSVAEQQMRRGLDANMAQAMAMAGATGGQNAGGALRALANQRAAMSQQTASDASMLRAQEQQQAQNTYGQLLAGMRGQDIGWATGQAQLAQQTGLANMQSQLQQRQMNDQMVQFYLHSGMSLAQAQQQAAMDLEKLRVQQNLAETAQRQQSYEAAAQANANLVKSVVGAFTGGIGGGMGGGGGGMAGQVPSGQFLSGAQTQGPGMMPSGWQLGGG